MSIQNALASIAVKELDKTVPWYEALLQARASRPMPEVAEWKFEGGGGLQVYALPERAGNCSCTLVIDDFKKQLQHLEQLGINTSQKSESSKIKVVMITDPDGNHIAMAQALDASLLK